MESNTLQAQIQELLHTSIRAYGVRENDAVSLKSLKLILLSQVLESLGLDWNYLFALFKTHTPVHPEIARELSRVGEEEVSNAFAQLFVRTEKIARLARLLNQSGVNADRILAVDGLGGNLEKGPSFEYKHYVANLKYGNRGHAKFFFDTDPEYKRTHAQTVRELYGKLAAAPVPRKQVYEILRGSFAEIARVNLPEIEMSKDETLDKKLFRECSQFYVKMMGKENIEKLAKNLKKVRGEKRSLERDDESPEPDEKR